MTTVRAFEAVDASWDVFQKFVADRGLIIIIKKDNNNNNNNINK